MPDQPCCPICLAPVAGGALAGLCPACLLRQGVEADSVTGENARTFEPPSVAELAPLFPQLEIFELIGHGGMGAVYKARQKELDRLVALKILPPAMENTAGFAERFSREAKALAKLNHPSIVTIHEFGRADGLFYFVMEFVDGVNLRQLLAAGRVSPREALAIVPEICNALQFAHDHGIVHRDIKPANILLDRRGRVKVADFGLAKLVAEREGTIGETSAPSSEISLSEAGRTMGTPNYMAPEQSEHPGEVDHRADIYALGVVFYQMLTGELPADRIAPPSRKADLDVRLDEVVLRALEKQPALRYQKASHVKDAVETIAGTPVAATVAQTVPPAVDGAVGAPRSIAKHSGARFAIAAIAVVGVGAVIWWAASQQRDTPQPQQPGPGQVEASSAKKSDGTADGASPVEKSRTTKVATINKETGVLEVTGSKGGALRLLAVSSYDKANSWWRPDGKPAPDTGIGIAGEPASREPLATKDHFFLWDGRSCTGSVSIDSASFEPAGKFVCFSSVYQNGVSLRGVWASRMTFPSSARTVTCRTEIGLDPWQTISTLDPKKLHYVRTPSPGAPAFLRWDDPIQTADGIRIGMFLSTDPRSDAKIIAVGKNGIEYSPFGGERGPIGQFTYYKFNNFTPIHPPERISETAEPLPQLTLAEVREFKAQVLPLNLVEFRDIALQPNAPLPPIAPK